MSSEEEVTKDVRSEDIIPILEDLDLKLRNAYFELGSSHKNFSLLAVGGTSLALQNLKGVSKDLDFYVDPKSIALVEESEEEKELKIRKLGSR